MDGSVEALSDSFSKLSTEEIQINIHKVLERLQKLTLCLLLLQMQLLSDLMFVLLEMRTISR
jgi:hypothetical protein